MKTNKPHRKLFQAHEIKVTGLVQGVGFRPFIYRLATEHNLFGFVLNQSDGVIIHIEGQEDKLTSFKNDIRTKAPAASKIDSIDCKSATFENYADFSISPSISIENVISGISPDIGVCPDCLDDLKNQKHRINYPFINCTNCGPRFTIIQDFPYDRVKTTMSEFQMCPECKEEYLDINDRRFHAQPIACNNCGPSYKLIKDQNQDDDQSNNSSINEILENACKQIHNDQIIAIKGLGGFHLACNAFSNKAVSKLRKTKIRDGKPFAVMFRDIRTAGKYCHLSTIESEELQSWRSPIVILSQKPVNNFAEGISVGFNSIGAFLPYLPLHHILFEKLEIDALVLSSCNLSDTPICVNHQSVINSFQNSPFDIITNNRKIFNRVDDSVVQEVNKDIQIIRRARGFVPSSIKLAKEVNGILAVGAELSNSFCIGKNNQAIFSQHIGDLKNFETLEFFEQTLDVYKRLFRFKPELVVADLHPNYISTQFAQSLGIEIVQVQHHQAHCLSVITEHSLQEPVIGISLDGTGYGTDGNTWGSEVLLLENDQFERKYHFEYQAIPGGDLATKEPWRSGLSYLHATFGESCEEMTKKLFHAVEPKKITKTLEMIQKQINSPLSCSAGRLFDAVVAILGICQDSTFHAEAPMRLEDLTRKINSDELYEIELSPTISFKPLIRDLAHDVLSGKNKNLISTKFHNSVAHILAKAVESIVDETGVKKVVISGGTFQNKYLTEKLLALLQHQKTEVYLPKQVPVNDGGIALGQLYYGVLKRHLQN